MKDSAQRSALLTWFIDPLEATRDSAQRAFRFTADRRAWLAPLGIGVALLVMSAIGYAVNPEQFYFSYLIGWTFCLSLAVGGLFFLFFQHLTRAEWSVVVRRIPEALVWTFPMLFVLGIPIVFGMHDLYHWTHAELYDPASPEYDQILVDKRAYLNTPFWLIRLVFYFGVWSLVSYKLYTLSVRQDVNPETDIPAKQRQVSAWGLPLTAVATAFASYDLLMSTYPHWFSTIFGIYFFSGSFLGAVCLISVISMSMQRGGMLKNVVTREHYHDLGKFTFGFVVFWAYIAFSQYMLIWYGGIPEETVWYNYRLEYGWGYHSAALLLGHFIIPFVLMLPRFVKRSRPILAFWSVWLLVMHWFDLHWIVAPVLHQYGGFHWLDFTCWLGLFGLIIGVVMYRLSRHALVPQNDPRLAASLRFENA
jgi:uncharacterized membrane protein (DUF485 family)